MFEKKRSEQGKKKTDIHTLGEFLTVKVVVIKIYANTYHLSSYSII